MVFWRDGSFLSSPRGKAHVPPSPLNAGVLVHAMHHSTSPRLQPRNSRGATTISPAPSSPPGGMRLSDGPRQHDRLKEKEKARLPCQPLYDATVIAEYIEEMLSQGEGGAADKPNGKARERGPEQERWRGKASVYREQGPAPALSAGLGNSPFPSSLDLRLGPHTSVSMGQDASRRTAAPARLTQREQGLSSPRFGSTPQSARTLAPPAEYLSRYGHSHAHAHAYKSEEAALRGKLPHRDEAHDSCRASVRTVRCPSVADSMFSGDSTPCHEPWVVDTASLYSVRSSQTVRPGVHPRTKPQFSLSKGDPLLLHETTPKARPTRIGSGSSESGTWVGDGGDTYKSAYLGTDYQGRPFYERGQRSLSRAEGDSAGLEAAVPAAKRPSAMHIRDWTSLLSACGLPERQDQQGPPLQVGEGPDFPHRQHSVSSSLASAGTSASPGASASMSTSTSASTSLSEPASFDLLSPPRSCSLRSQPLSQQSSAQSHAHSQSRPASPMPGTHSTVPRLAAVPVPSAANGKLHRRLPPPHKRSASGGAGPPLPPPRGPLPAIPRGATAFPPVADGKRLARSRTTTTTTTTTHPQETGRTTPLYSLRSRSRSRSRSGSGTTTACTPTPIARPVVVGASRPEQQSSNSTSPSPSRRSGSLRSVRIERAHKAKAAASAAARDTARPAVPRPDSPTVPEWLMMETKLLPATRPRKAQTVPRAQDRAGKHAMLFVVFLDGEANCTLAEAGRHLPRPLSLSEAQLNALDAALQSGQRRRSRSSRGSSSRGSGDGTSFNTSTSSWDSGSRRPRWSLQSTGSSQPSSDGQRTSTSSTGVRASRSTSALICAVSEALEHGQRKRRSYEERASRPKSTRRGRARQSMPARLKQHPRSSPRRRSRSPRLRAGRRGSTSPMLGASLRV